MVSFIEVFRDKFLSNVKEVTNEGEWKVVIMDAFSYKIFSITCEDSDLLNLNVKAIEQIHTARPKSPTDIAVYFLLPTASNVDLLLNDFQDSRNKRYKEAHLFFLSPVATKEFKKLSSNVSKYWKSLKELYIDYLPFESKIFSLDRPESFYCLYSASKQYFESEIAKISRRLLSIILTLGEVPIIRYQEMAEGSLGIAKSIALKFQNTIDIFLSKHPELLNNQTESGQRPLWIFMDRSSDLLTPIMHSITYQALVNDFLNLKDGRIYKHTFINGHGEEKEEEVILSESDTLWNELRHHHISDVAEFLLNSLKSLSCSNAAAANLMGRNGEENKLPTVKEMRDIVTAVPELQMLAKQYSVHINLANECLDTISKGFVEKCIEAEQDLAMGMDSEGNHITNPLSIIAPLLNSLQVPVRAKLRLIISYILHFYRHPKLPNGTDNNPPSESSLRRLINHAGLSEQDRSTVTHISHLLSNKPFKLIKPATSYLYSLLWRNDNAEKIHEEDEGELFALSRFKCEVNRVLGLATKKRLDPTEFPFANEADKLEVMNQLTAKKGLRVSKPRWQKKKKRSNINNTINSIKLSDNNHNNLINESTLNFEMDDEDDTSIYRSNGRIVLFMAGGLTYSEMRDAYDIGKKAQQEILVGSTHILTPSIYLDHLRNMFTFDFKNIEIEKPEELSVPVLPSPSPSPHKDSYINTNGKTNNTSNISLNNISEAIPINGSVNKDISLTKSQDQSDNESINSSISNNPAPGPATPPRPQSYTNREVNNSRPPSKVYNEPNKSRSQSQIFNEPNIPNNPPATPLRPQSQVYDKPNVPLHPPAVPPRPQSRGITEVDNSISQSQVNDELNNNVPQSQIYSQSNNSNNSLPPIPQSMPIPIPMPMPEAPIPRQSPSVEIRPNSAFVPPGKSVEHMMSYGKLEKQNNTINNLMKSNSRPKSSAESLTSKHRGLTGNRNVGVDMTRNKSAPTYTEENKSNEPKAHVYLDQPLPPLTIPEIRTSSFMPEPQFFPPNESPMSSSPTNQSHDALKKERKERKYNFKRYSTLERKGGVRKSNSDASDV